jgi:hypothetical protein
MDDHFDKFILSLETMIDAQDEMFEDEKYGNYRQRLHTLENVYLPAKEEMRKAFNEAVKQVVIETLTQTLNESKNYVTE